MKTFTNSLLVGLALVAVLFGCRPDRVDPANSDNPAKVAGAFDDTHPTLDTVCKYADSVHFRSVASTNGTFPATYIVNKCVGTGGSAIICSNPGGQQRWGSFVMYNGYEYVPNQAPVHWLDVDFNLAGGWFCDFTNWQFTTANNLQVDPNTGFPSVGTDWNSLVLNPMRNQWKVAILINSLPLPCFDMACRMSILRVRLNGSPNENFRTTVWAINPNWNNPNSEYQSANEFVIHYCPFACLPEPCSTITNTVCTQVYSGITCSNTLNATTLTADASGAGSSPTYIWSTGATTASINVAPTASTAYTVTISNGTCDYRVTTFQVNVTNVACSVPDPRADFCPANLDIRPGMSFNIRNYVRMKNNLPVDWNTVRFTYTDVGANAPTVTADWNLAAFNAGQTVTVTTTDAATGRGNVARGEYRIYVYRQGQSTYDDYMTIRVHPSRVANVSTAACVGGACGYIPGIRVCSVPPGNPSGATSLCVSYDNFNGNINGVCGSTGANSGNYLGICGANPCSN